MTSSMSASVSNSKSGIPAYHHPVTRTPQIFLEGDFSAQSCPVARKNSLYKPRVHECYHAKKNKNMGQPSALIGNVPFRPSQSGMLFTQRENPRRELNLAFLACGVIVSAALQASDKLNQIFCNYFKQLWMFFSATIRSRVLVVLV